MLIMRLALFTCMLYILYISKAIIQCVYLAGIYIQYVCPVKERYLKSIIA
jgi:hypothetical protein